MFNRKKREIERLQKNITKINENRMELSGENVRLQKEVANLNEKFTCLEKAITEESQKIANLYKFFKLEKDATIIPEATEKYVTNAEIKPKKKGTKKDGTK